MFLKDRGKPISFGQSVGIAKMKEFTYGLQFEGKNSRSFDYLFFGALQKGNFGEKDISAKAFKY